MAKYTLDTSRPASLSQQTEARFASQSEAEREAQAFSAGHPATTDEELDRAVAARRVRTIRLKHRLSEDDFSRILHVPIANLRDWEDGRRLPDAAALALLTVFDKEPEAFRRAFSGHLADIP